MQPDPDTQALFDRFDLYGDPVRAAQIVLGELAVIWKEAPVPPAPIVRGIAVAPPPTLPPAMWSPLLRRITEAPFLEPVTATGLVEQVDPPNPNTESALAAPASSFFDPAYADRIDSLRGRVEAYGSMLGPTSDIPIELRRKLFVATAPPYVGDPSAGEPWLAAVDTTTRQAFDAVMPTVSDKFTFTSREGTIPIVMGDPGDTPVRVTVELDRQGLLLPGGKQPERLAGRARTDRGVPGGGQHVGTEPDPGVGSSARTGSRCLTDPPGPVKTIVVRTTTVNHIALLVTIGAGLGLLALYSRRWFRRRKNPA